MRWWSGSLDEARGAMVDSIDTLCDSHAAESECARWDREHEFPGPALKALADAGWSTLPVVAEFGGTGACAADLVVVHQALARRSLTLAQSYYSLWVIGAESISRLGTRAHKVEWLPLLATGEARVAFALTEPGSGSDAAALRTRALRTRDDFLVSGQKTFISGAAQATRIITAVRTADGESRHQGISLLLIDPKSDGVSINPLDKVGLRGLDLCEVFFDNVKVPQSEVLGTLDSGWTDLRSGLAAERLYLAAISLGALCDVIGRCATYARTRETFGKPIGSHQLIADKIVRMRVDADAAAGLVGYAAGLMDQSDTAAAVAASVAKLFATRAYVSACADAVQIFGGYGYTEDFGIGRHYRDCKYLEIGGGSSEMQTILIARSMGLSL